MVLKLEKIVGGFKGLKVLDMGCGEGKNAVFCASHGATVRALDISEVAIEKAKALWNNADSVQWETADIRHMKLPACEVDIVIAYGLLHCLSSEEEIVGAVRELQNTTRVDGYHVVCAMNNRLQEFEAAHPRLEPWLLSHEQYLSLYKGWELLEQSDSDLHETHPHNCIPHRHSMTRFIAMRTR